MIAMRRPDDEEPEIDILSFVEHIDNFTGAVRTVDRNLDRIATALERIAEQGDNKPSGRIPLQATSG